MMYQWSMVFDLVDRNNRDIVITSGLTGEQKAPNIINAVEKMRRAIENDTELNAERPTSANVTSCTQQVNAAADEGDAASVQADGIL